MWKAVWKQSPAADPEAIVCLMFQLDQTSWSFSLRLKTSQLRVQFWELFRKFVRITLKSPSSYCNEVSCQGRSKPSGLFSKCKQKKIEKTASSFHSTWYPYVYITIIACKNWPICAQLLSKVLSNDINPNNPNEKVKEVNVWRHTSLHFSVAVSSKSPHSLRSSRKLDKHASILNGKCF